MGGTVVNVDNFARAESDRMFSAILRDPGVVNRWFHFREPTPIEHQPVIRQNRDTLYSVAIVDISKGATVTLPDGGGRYVSVMVVNQNHYINRVFHDAGDYELTVEEFETPYVLTAARVLVDPAEPDDVAAVNALQDRFGLRVGSDQPFALPDYDDASHTFNWSNGLTTFSGSREQVDIKVGAASLTMSAQGITLQLGATGLSLDAAGVHLSGPVVDHQGRVISRA